MPATPTSIHQVRSSHLYHFLYGRFSLLDYSIPYLVVSMRLSDAAQELHIPEEATPSGLNNAELEELFQRDIDWDRVTTKIVPYLKNERRPQFFNALTVMILPYNGGRFGRFADPDFAAPRLDQEFSERDQLTIGPVRLGVYGGLDPALPEQIQFGKVCWNPDQVKCVAIDGQHRLGAIKQLHEQAGAGLDESYIPVLLVLPSEQLGYVAPGELEDQVRLMRALFTDLNKHAVSVSRAREILLDDFDPQSLCVRRTVEKRLTDIDGPTRECDSTRIPLALVDWRSNEAKFDDGPYVTTMLVLDQVVGGLLNVKPIRDWTDLAEVRKQMSAFSALGWEQSDECRSRLEIVKQSEEGRPFSYPREDLDGIVRAFGRTWSPSINYLLTESRAYREFIEWRRSKDMLTADFVFWFHAYQRAHPRGKNDPNHHRTHNLLLQTEGHLHSQDPPINTKVWKDISQQSCYHEHKKDSLFFRVVFQKALFMSLSVLSVLTRDEEAYGDAEQQLPTSADRRAWEHMNDSGRRIYLWAMDTVSWQARVPEDMFRLDHRTSASPSETFWLGTVVRADAPETIDFTAAAAKRASHWLSLGTIFSYSLSVMPELAEIDATEHPDLEEFIGSVVERLPESVVTLYWTLFRNISGNKRGRAMFRIVQAEHRDTDNPAIREDYFFARVRHLWELIRTSP